MPIDLEQTQVREVMTSRPITIHRTSPVRAAVSTLVSLDVRHLPVVNDAGELVGMVSERDLRGPPLGRDPDGQALLRLDEPIANVMIGPVEVVEAGDPLREAVALMLDERIGAVPVVDARGHLVGIVSYVDVLKRLLGS